MMRTRINLSVFGEDKHARVEFGPVDGRGDVAVKSLELSRADLLALAHVFHAIAVSPNYVRGKDPFQPGFDTPDTLSINVGAVFGRSRKKARPEGTLALHPLDVTPPK